MKETTHIRNLLESIQLNEYLVQEGEPISAVLQLNLFTDAETRPSEYEEDFAANPEWMAVEKKYYDAIAIKLEQMVKESNLTLDEDDVDTIHIVWYDGSDSYESPEEALESLVEIYKAQIKVVQDLLAGTSESANDEIEVDVDHYKKSREREAEINRKHKASGATTLSYVNDPNTSELDKLDDDVEGELLTKDRSSTGGIARDIIAGAQKSLYEKGIEPNKRNVRDQADAMANVFHNKLLQAIDQELDS